MPTESLHLSTSHAISMTAAVAIYLLFPVVLALFLRRRLGGSWRALAAGALIYFIFQLIAGPLLANLVLKRFEKPNLYLFQQPLLLLVVVFVVALAAEVGRYVGYRWLLRHDPYTKTKAIMYGAGHGGMESILPIGLLALFQLIALFYLGTHGLSSLSPKEAAEFQLSVTRINREPAWMALIPAYQELWTMAIQIGFSLLVLQVFRRGQFLWLGLAVVVHTLLDFWSGWIEDRGMNMGTQGPLLLGALVTTVFGLLALAVILSLRDATPASPALPLTPA